MRTIRNPNEIVDEFVGDYRGAFCENLISVIMYGSAVTHEYQPGVSDINMAVVVSDLGISLLNTSIPFQKKWHNCRVATPFFMSRESIGRSLDTYPVEFLTMKLNYRVLWGEDVLSGLEIEHEHLRLQCERELRGKAIHLRKAFVESEGRQAWLIDILHSSLRSLLPVFKAILVLEGATVPGTKSDLIAAVEDTYNLGISVLSDIYHRDARKLKKGYVEVFDQYCRLVDTLIERVDRSSAATIDEKE